MAFYSLVRIHIRVQSSQVPTWVLNWTWSPRWSQILINEVQIIYPSCIFSLRGVQRHPIQRIDSKRCLLPKILSSISRGLGVCIISYITYLTECTILCFWSVYSIGQEAWFRTSLQDRISLLHNVLKLAQQQNLSAGHLGSKESK